MKILMVSLSFEPSRVSDYPGVNRYSIGLVKALVDRGIRVQVVTPLHHQLPEVETWNGVEIRRIKNTKSMLGRLGTVAFANLLSFGVNLQRKPRLFDDIDLLQTDIPLPIRGPILRTIPLVYVVHHTYRIWSGNDLLWAPVAILAAGLAAQAADALVVPSHTVAREASTEYDVPPAKIQAIHHGVDASFFGPRSGDAGGGGHPEVLYVGLLEKRKGISELIRAFAELRAAEPEAKLTLVGGGPEREWVLKRSARSDLSGSVRLRENLSDSELGLALDQADIFAFPSLQEGFGFAAVEAMARGKPVLAFDTPINREVIGKGGILVTWRDPTALASAMQTLISDPTLARNLGASARIIASQRYDWRTTAKDYHQLYTRLVLDNGLWPLR